MKVFILTRKKLLILSILIILSLLIAGVNTIISVSTSNKMIPIYSVARPDNKIALTFNCAWGNEDIQKVLDILDNHNAKATFFVVGAWAEKYPDSLKEIYKRGHEIAGHSYNHAHYKNMSYQEILDDLEKCDKAIESVIKKDISLFRGGYGEYSDDVLKVAEKTNRTYIQWSVDSLDYSAKSSDEIIKRVADKTKSGDIILMHTGTDFTASALDDILRNLSENYDFVLVSDLIYKDNFTIDHSGKQAKNSPPIHQKEISSLN